MKTLKEQIEDLDISHPQDIDPEDDPFAKRDDDSDSDEAPSEVGIGGREHYEEVSKSKLRRPDQPVLGKQYTGAAVSRKTLFDEEGNEQVEDVEPAEDDDDEVAEPIIDSKIQEPSSSASKFNGSHQESPSSNLEDDTLLSSDDASVVAPEESSDSEIDSDEAFGSGDEEDFKSKGFTFRGTKKNIVTEDSAEEGNSDEDGALMWDTDDEVELDNGEDIDMDGIASEFGSTSEDVSDDNSSSDMDASLDPPNQSNAGREKLKALLRNDAAAVASTLSASANADSLKGKAVKQQYQTFDRLLDARIKLQKGLSAANSLSLPSSLNSDVSVAAQSAESAALRLFSTIESIRFSVCQGLQEEPSKKRKRPPPATTATPTQALWESSNTLEKDILIHRRAILNRWSSKTRSANGISVPRSQLDRGPQIQESITDILDAQVLSENQKAPPGTAAGAYDDSAFYQSLLRDLISSRASLNQSQSIVSDIPLPSAPKQHRKGVDVKASKGRKIRYTVHERLQNFMAEEPRGTWTDSARVEFFASLFGGQGQILNEDMEVDDEEGADESEHVGEESALRLFRS